MTTTPPTPTTVEPDITVDPRVTIGYFRHPYIAGTDIDPECGHRWHDHGWIDSTNFDGRTGRTVCPAEYGPFGGQTVTELGRAARSL